MEETINLFEEYPKAMKTVPILIANRGASVELLTLYDRTQYLVEKLEFSENSDPQAVATFLDKAGLLDLLKENQIKSVVDYVTGVEVGLDSNGRKNRGGKAMEAIVWFLLDEMSKANEWSIMQHATQKDIKKNWGFEIQIREANKIIDFAINANGVLILIETNFYNSGGSKLKSTATEYESVWNSYGVPFIWITDGNGWRGNNALKDAFDTIDHVLNINMVQSNLLQDIIIDHIKLKNDQRTTNSVLTRAEK